MIKVPTPVELAERVHAKQQGLIDEVLTALLEQMEEKFDISDPKGKMVCNIPTRPEAVLRAVEGLLSKSGWSASHRSNEQNTVVEITSTE